MMAVVVPFSKALQVFLVIWYLLPFSIRAFGVFALCSVIVFYLIKFVIEVAA